MIKYTICSDHRTLDENAFRNQTKWVDDMFHIIEEKGLEEQLRRLKPGEVLTVSFHSLNPELTDTICHYFRCTGKNKGHFTQRLQEPSGLTNHANSLEFTYE